MARHHVHTHELRLKGWSEEEIQHAQQVLERAEEKRHPVASRIDTFVLIALFILGVLGIGVFSLYAIPLFFVLPPHVLYTTLALLGLLFGMLFTVAIADMHHLSTHHHITNAVLFPVITFFAFVFILTSAQHFDLPELFHPHNVIFSALAFALGMLAPYMYHFVTTKRFIQ